MKIALKLQKTVAYASEISFCIPLLYYEWQ